MENLVKVNNEGKATTTSYVIAEIYGKRHSDVLRDIRNLHLSDEFREANFALMVKMKELPQGGASKSNYYEITKNGFTFLVMGYTGTKAAEFKIKFINEFNRRDSLLKSDDYILARSKEILERRLNLLEQQIYQKDEQLQLQEHVLQQQAPKVEFYDAVTDSKTAIDMGRVAKVLDMGGYSVQRRPPIRSKLYRHS